MLPLLSGLGASAFVAPPGLQPEESAAALTTCLDAPDRFGAMGEPPRFADLDLSS